MRIYVKLVIDEIALVVLGIGQSTKFSYRVGTVGTADDTPEALDLPCIRQS